MHGGPVPHPPASPSLPLLPLGAEKCQGCLPGWAESEVGGEESEQQQVGGWGGSWLGFALSGCLGPAAHPPSPPLLPPDSFLGSIGCAQLGRWPGITGASLPKGKERLEAKELSQGMLCKHTAGPSGTLASALPAKRATEAEAAGHHQR